VSGFHALAVTGCCASVAHQVAPSASDHRLGDRIDTIPKGTLDVTSARFRATDD
jgi:hypothetical protein